MASCDSDLSQGQLTAMLDHLEIMSSNSEEIQVNYNELFPLKPASDSIIGRIGQKHLETIIKEFELALQRI